jgi:hypothetical protein
MGHNELATGSSLRTASPDRPLSLAPLLSAETGIAVVIGVVALLVYSRTMYPGLVGDGDTPKFQFVGRILGTPHNPGYPLYTLLSYAFAQLPWGSAAYRINLMSVAFGSLTAGIAFLVLRRLGCGTWSAAATALAQAFGPVLWSQALLAEVYTLATTLLLAVLLFLLGWAASGRAALLYTAMAFFALGLGHHHADMVAIAPAVLLYAFLWEGPSLFRLRNLVALVTCVALGFSLYGFVVLRTIQHAPYLGSTATNLRELFGVLGAAQFSNRLFAFSLGVVLRERVPLIGRLFLQELGTAGIALFLVGLVLLLRRRPRETLLLAGGAAGVVSFALNYDVPDTPVFVIPAFVLSWPFVGVGLDGLLGWVGHRFRWRVGALALILPAGQLLSHYRTHDHHRHVFEMRYFRALFEALPNHSAIVSESYTVDQMVLYELFGEDFVRQKEILLVGRDADSAQVYLRKGYQVYSFERGRAELASRGFRLAPVRLLESPLEGYLQELPRGSIVLLAGPIEAQDDLIQGATAAMRSLGGGDVSQLPRGGCYVVVGVAGASRGALVAADPEEAQFVIGSGQPIGETGIRAPQTLGAACTPAGGFIEVNGREVARASSGLALVVVSTSGRLADRRELDSAQALRVPFDSRPFPFFRVAEGPSCLKLASGEWSDLSPDATWGRLLERIDGRPARGRLSLYVAGNVNPRLAGPPHRMPLAEEREFHGADGRPALQSALQEDGLGHGHSLSLEEHVHRFEAQSIDDADRSLLILDLGGVPRQAWARITLDPSSRGRATLCRLPIGGASFFEDSSRVVVDPADRAFFGQGWREPERDGIRLFRAMGGPEAIVLVPLSRSGPIRVTVRVRPPGGTMLLKLCLVVNGQSGETVPLREGWSTYEWRTSGRLWRTGSNELRLRVSAEGGSGARGVAVGPLRLSLESPPF